MPLGVPAKLLRRSELRVRSTNFPIKSKLLCRLFVSMDSCAHLTIAKTRFVQRISFEFYPAQVLRKSVVKTALGSCLLQHYMRHEDLIASIITKTCERQLGVVEVASRFVLPVVFSFLNC
jgi:hypothetical protein